MSWTKPMSGGGLFLYNGCQTIMKPKILKAGVEKIFQHPLQTTTLHYGCFKTLPMRTPPAKTCNCGCWESFATPAMQIQGSFQLLPNRSWGKSLYKGSIYNISTEYLTGARVKQVLTPRVLRA